jgi:predicted nucleic acid-binding Zn ribbon protein
MPGSKHCAVCAVAFIPQRMGQRVCSPGCAIQHAQKSKRRRQARANPTAASYTKNAQRAFNRYIRIRDSNRPCIVHGDACTSTSFDCGHYRSIGSMPALRFNTRNAHRQCSSSNQGSHKFARWERSVQGLYRDGLVARYGDEYVTWLDGPHQGKQYKIPDLLRITRIFNAKARLYERLFR